MAARIAASQPTRNVQAALKYRIAQELSRSITGLSISSITLIAKLPLQTISLSLCGKTYHQTTKRLSSTMVFIAQSPLINK